eukprot:TRINITY_DN6937_c1_g1_i1.p1 TRINITY_DN6937_c1_g1~~TRINITY_DN6937_c1_g1_i1.p1  ORF type:complete len:436 (+),score=65.16 TRINITY_DN6937_c1_g1_i1:73-1380(+)
MEYLPNDVFSLMTQGCVAVLCLVNGVSWLTRSKATSDEAGEDKNGIRWKYAAAFLCFKLGDWMQGPYFHRMYSEKVESQSDVAMLFLVGFLSAAVFGIVSSQLLPRIGSRKGTLLCPTMFLLGTLTVVYDDYSILLLGRVLGGAASAAMHTVPETWFFNKVHADGMSSSMVSSFMSWLFFIDGLGGIASGHLANFAAETTGTSTAPFLLAAAPACVGFLVVAVLWSEEGSACEEDSSEKPSFMSSFRSVCTSKKLLLLVLVQTLFEGTLYLFVMNWGRALVEVTPGGNVPFGQVFASLMTASMIGSSLLTLLKEKANLSPLGLIIAAALTGLVSFYLMSFVSTLRVFGILLYEVSVGMYFPAISLVRSELLSPSTRISLSQVIRIPVNAIVIVLMLNYERLGTTGAFDFSKLAMIGVTLCGFLSIGGRPAKDKSE